MLDWRDYAACAAKVATAESPSKARWYADMWYPDTLDASPKIRRLMKQEAEKICASCRVAETCERMRPPGDKHGIRNGHEVPTRRAAECGTPSGYYRHRRVLKEKACDACKAAHSADQRDREQRKAAA